MGHESYGIQLDWESANAQCSTIWEGATLAIMPNIHYQWFMTSMLATAEGKSRGNPYIGILSNQNDGRDHQFHWVDNTPLEFTNWAKNESDGKSEDGSIYVADLIVAAPMTGTSRKANPTHTT